MLNIALLCEKIKFPALLVAKIILLLTSSKLTDNHPVSTCLYTYEV